MSVPRVLKDVIRPRGTEWVRAHISVSYSCDAAPSKPIVQVTGVNYLGFVFMSGYEFNAEVDGGTVEACEIDDCVNALQYRFRVRLESFLVLGLGFTSGVATGSFSWKSSPMEDVIEYETPCFCCDAPIKPRRLSATDFSDQSNAKPALLASIIAATSVVAMPVALWAISRGSSVIHALIGVVLGAVALALLSLGIAVLRQRQRSGSVKAREPEALSDRADR